MNLHFFKRAICLFIISITCCRITLADNYAILISAGQATSDVVITNTEYWFDLYLTYEYLLLEEQYDSSKVFVFYGDGNDYNSLNPRYKKELHNWGNITDYNNSKTTLNSVITSLDSVITEEDNLLFFWLVGHGQKNDSTSDDSYVVWIENYNEEILKNQLVALINSITHYNRRKIFWMTCHSGAMGGGYYNVNDSKTTLVTSSTSNELSYSEYFNSEPHATFDYALFSLSTGVDPHGSLCPLVHYLPTTAIEDSLLSVNELHSGISTFISLNTNMLSYPQHPCIFDMGDIANKIFIGENKQMKNSSMSTNSSYWLDRLILSDVEIESDIDISIDVDVQSEIRRNTFVPIGTTMVIK